MTNEAALLEGVRRKFAETDTAVLRVMWQSEDRTDWAESALREELIARGESPARLDELASRRAEIAASAPPDAKELAWDYGILGRILTLAAICLWWTITQAIVHWTPLSLAGSTAIVAVYAWLLTRRTTRQTAHPSSGMSRALWGWQLLVAWAFVGIGVIATLLSLF